MTDAIVSRLGQVKQAGAEDALFVQVFTGEVLTAFQENYKLDGRVTVRNITQGKSASFAAIGISDDAAYHVPGTEILGGTVDHNEVIVTLDPVMTSSKFLADIDEAQNHYEVRAPYSAAMGTELAQKRTFNELSCVAQAARTEEGPVSGQPGGAVIKNAAMATDAYVLANAFKQARQVGDEKNWPERNGTGALPPAQYYLLTENKDLIHKDITAGSYGDYNEATLRAIAGFDLLKLNLFPKGDRSADAKLLAKYRLDFSDTVALIWTPDAVATLQLMGLGMQIVPQPHRLGTLMIAKYALGHGPLRAGQAIELSKAV
ncbi:hypothetical protein [Coralloluteibacterium stylophorae]|uniref:Capsid Gp10A/Gp10B-like domain-containing protein n=1 Tax=Coralloluteibacterium stylophorae TaxID=1776034 RepID=A0A8J8AX97_9GAMM|nr:hypothetical protein [Coralloluteibacterium stylophorae]MBS7457691.1 hypothetical protein [Coralloluteibacterium stylophorae]